MKKTNLELLLNKNNKNKSKKKKKKIDPLECNVPNIYFGHVKEHNDSRYKKYKKQRLERGFDDSETWNLDNTFVDFIIPRLERYLEISKEVIAHEHKDLININKVLDGLKIYQRYNEYPFNPIINIYNSGNFEYKKELFEDENYVKEFIDYLKIKDAFDLFPKIIHTLWW